ncbi:MAG: ABC transporter permease [Candidatus Falkowbacteria bacterium]|nr:ABC transporter permease [Candidatus Falkowbacteria bacterium]
MEIVIRPKNKLWQMDWKELWVFRDLFYFLAWKDVKVKYKQTVVGAGWAIFQPVITMIVFSVFFGKFAKMPSDGVPYPIFIYSGLLFWNLFATSLNEISGIFIGNERIISKVYFPKIILPVSAIITNVLDFAVASVVFIGMMFYYGFSPSIISIILLPLLFLMTVLSALGIGLLFGSVNVKYRDVRYILPFFIQILIFITPVIYPVSIISAEYRWILGLNPMAGVIDTARVVLLGVGNINWLLLLVSFLCMAVYCLFGFIAFKKIERYFADII